MYLNVCMELSTAVYSMLAYRWGRQAGQVRYRCVGHDEGGPMGCIETFLEAPIRSLAAQDSLQCGSYIISNRGMERMAMYNEEERRRRANARNQLVNLPVSQSTAASLRYNTAPQSHELVQPTLVLCVVGEALDSGYNTNADYSFVGDLLLPRREGTLHASKDVQDSAQCSLRRVAMAIPP